MTSFIMTGVFSINNTNKISAINNGQLKVGTYIEAGYGIRPGENCPNIYDYDTIKDTFDYTNGQYIRINIGPKSYTLSNPELGVFYITQQKIWVSKGSHTGGEYHIIPDEGAYYKNGKYIFYIYSDTDLKGTPISLEFKAEDTGPAWGVKVVSGDGSQGDPFTFALVKYKPHDIVVDTVEGGGKVELDYTRAEPGETVTFKALPGSGNEVNYVQVNTDTAIDVTKNGDVYSFVMPENYHEGYETVKIHVGFKQTTGAFEIEDTDGKVTSYDDLHNAKYDWKPGTILRLKKDIFEANDIEAYQDYGTGNYILDLNGFTYTCTVSNQAVEVNNGQNIIIRDSSENKSGKITHLQDLNTGYGAVVNEGGKLTLESGTITGNKNGTIEVANDNGAGVYVASGGTFNMTGGTISGNTAKGNGAGVYVAEGGTFNMTGGSISSNSADGEGAGVYNAGTFKVSGNVTVNNNHKGSDDSNTAFGYNKKITISGQLADSARIGVTYEAGQVFTDGFEGKATVNNFISNVSGKTIFVTDEKELKLDEETPYDLWVNGIRVTDANANAIPVESGSATYDYSSNTLTLKDATILFDRVEYSTIAYDAGIFYVGNRQLNIKLEGTNTIKQSNNEDKFYSSYRAHGIRSNNADINIYGDENDGRDTLNITYKKGNVDSVSYMNGVYAYKNDTVISSADVNIDTDSGYLAYSIYTNDLRITNANVKIINDAKDDNTTGIYAYSEGEAPSFIMDNLSSLEITAYGQAIDGKGSIKAYNDAAKPTGLGALVNTDATEEGAHTFESGTLVRYKYVKMPYVPSYTITWKDGDGRVLKTESVEKGIVPKYTGITPTKASTAEYEYTFNNTWSPVVVAATQDQTYTAQFNSTTRT